VRLNRVDSALVFLGGIALTVVDLIRDFVVHRDVALEGEARKRGVLADFEYLAN
jgi:hypothetical protein